MLLNRSIKVAFCGVASALATALMFLTGLIPVATYALPALAGLPCVAIVVELGVRWAWPVYFTCSVLSILLAGDKEAVLLFILFFGYYPILKATLEKLRRPILSWILKFLVFNTAMILGFFAAVFFLGVPKGSFSFGGVSLPWLFLLAGNAVFFLYDNVISGLVITYYQRFHRLVAKWIHKK